MTSKTCANPCLVLRPTLPRMKDYISLHFNNTVRWEFPQLTWMSLDYSVLLRHLFLYMKIQMYIYKTHFLRKTCDIKSFLYSATPNDNCSKNDSNHGRSWKESCLHHHQQFWGTRLVAWDFPLRTSYFNSSSTHVFWKLQITDSLVLS